MEKISVYKIGGNVIDDAASLASFLSDFSKLEGKKVLVHGGGKYATALSKQLGIEPKMIDGRRITDADTLEVVLMVYAGAINKRVVAQLDGLGCRSIGLSGADGNLIRSKKRPKVGEVDFGFVGDVEQVNAPFLRMLLEEGLAPVCCALTHDGNGQMLNTNADTVANEIAVALAKYYEVSLCYIFEKDGVLSDPKDDSSVIGNIDKEAFQRYKADGTISAGMIPKLDNAFSAIGRGVARVVIGAPRMLRGEGEGPTIIH